MNVLETILVLLGGSVAAVAIFRRLALPPILGYLLVGVVLGPSTKLLIGDLQEIRFIAEFGVVFLLFTIGLEFSLPQLLAMRWTVLGLGGAQVLITSIGVGLVAWWLGASPQGAVVVGGALAMSSTAIVSRQLAEQYEINSPHGRKAVGVLLFQDLAAVPLLIAIPILAGHSDSLALPLALALLKGLAVFAGMIMLGRWLLRPLFREVASAYSNELFTLTVLLVALLAAWATELAGLSLALGAFLAGIMLGETEFRHQIEADIRPFRDVLLGLFFISVGMLVDVRVLAQIWPSVIVVSLLLMLFKALLVAALIRLGGDGGGVAVRTGLTLGEGGEFGFAILSLALADGVISHEASQIALTSILLSMALAPFLIRYDDPIASRLLRGRHIPYGSRIEHALELDTQYLNQHVILCGYGRTGQNVGRFLEREGIPYFALDLDPARVREAATAGDPVSFGDAARREILQSAGIERAALVVITYDDPAATLQVLQHTRAVRPDLPILVRTGDDTWLERFQEAGATVIVPEVLEASLMLAAHTLALLEIPLSRVFRYVRQVRTDRYRLLRGFFHGEEHIDLENAERFRDQLHAVVLPEQAYAVGRTLAELGLEVHEIEVTAVRRGGIRGPQPEPDTILQAGDVLVLYGSPERLEQAEGRLLGG
ncbi:MAG TPA: monovalent cation:proton antiporter-2 (CPA2) family protein [Gammaproteobacteria bacterium]|nr:monovalent cation:proton antiporter-2 (CPA2) family protein [Gammaproteobacteria bacterium]